MRKEIECMKKKVTKPAQQTHFVWKRLNVNGANCKVH